jgi:hypothetical protein
MSIDTAAALAAMFAFIMAPCIVPAIIMHYIFKLLRNR